jgi:polar amino acid transport system substrate-binding protein
MRALVVAVALVMALFARSAAECPESAPPHKLVVGTVPIAPFIIKNADGTWGGISMDLWAKVAGTLKLDYEVKELTVADLANPQTMTALDAFVSLNVTAEREAQLDLTHAFYSTGLAIAVAPHGDDGLGATFRAIFTAKFAKLIIALMALLFGVGVVMWLVERKRNESQFGGPAAKGIGAGLWWSAVTMTTVGYGDKAPVTLLGRLLGLVWMFAAIIIISSFTAAIASALTVNQLSTAVSGPNDLPKVKVGTVDPSQAKRYLATRRIPFKGYKDITAAVDALAAGQVDAVVFEAPILQYAVHARSEGDLLVLDGTFDNHGYAFGLRQCSPLREDVNLALLRIVASDDWAAILSRYLGTP